jgi:hypothetical protein
MGPHNVHPTSEKELAALHARYAKLSEMAKRDIDLLKSHSIEEAQARHRSKLRSGGPHSPKGPQQAQEEHRSEEPDQPAGR